MRKLTKTLLATIAVALTMICYTACCEHEENVYIVGNGNINGIDKDSLTNLVINLYNQQIKSVKSVVDSSAIWKYAKVTDAKFLFFNDNDVVVGEYYTALTSNGTAYTDTMPVPASTKRIMALCNKDLNAPDLVDISTMGLTYNQVLAKEYDVAQQTHAITSIALTGEADDVDLSAGVVNISVSPVPARLEIGSIRVDFDGVDASLVPTSTEIVDINIHNVYNGVALNKTTYSGLIDIDDTNYFLLDSATNKLTTIGTPDWRHYDINKVGTSASAGYSLVWGFQVLPVAGEVPHITVMFKFTYSTGVVYKYLNVNKYVLMDGSGNVIEPIEYLPEFERGVVYYISSLIYPFSALSPDPGITNTLIPAKITVKMWEDIEIGTDYTYDYY